MSDLLGDRASIKRQRTAVEAFIGALVKGARTIALYKEGHSIIGQVVGRVNELLKAAIGEEPNITLEFKAKSVIFYEDPLTESPEMISLASALHSLGVGQVLFTNRLQDDGMRTFMDVLSWKADGKVTLTDLQKKAQELRIDGMQMVSIMSFVVTGEEDESQQKPGELSEEQIAAFVRAGNLPDFIYLLLKQNEPLNSKEAERITELFDQVLRSDISVEAFERDMPWDAYDARVRARWDELRADLNGRSNWTDQALYSQLSMFGEHDLEAKKNHQVMEASEAFRHALKQVHAILEHPAGGKQPDYALQAYARFLSDLGRTGNLPSLLRECGLWRSLAGDPKWGAYLATLKKEVQERIPTLALAESLVGEIAEVEEGSERRQEILDFVLTIGRAIVPMLLEKLADLSDKESRKKVCAFLTELGRRFGTEDLVKALKSKDYLMVVQMAHVLADIKPPDLVKQLKSLTRHPHPKVRTSVVRLLTKFDGSDAAEAVFQFLVESKKFEENQAAIANFSHMAEKSVADKLISVYRRNDDYDTQTAVVTALGRFHGPAVVSFLEEAAVWPWLDWVMGRNKALKRAAKASLRRAKGEKEVQDDG